jgi:L-seryl-tRNA(Ser) seleniumtransferase
MHEFISACDVERLLVTIHRVSQPAALRALPGVHVLLQHAQTLITQEGHDRTVLALRQSLDDARALIRAGESVDIAPGALIARATDWLAAASGDATPVVNATGVIIHTNLGRAPMSLAAQRAMLHAAGGYSPLEFDLETGGRGKRGAAVERLLCELTGAEAALVVNNCAAATVLMLAAHAAGRGVVVSRGQLVEIGGGFRVPEIMRQSGATLVEVGTTNRVKASDYAAAAEDEDVAALLRVHASNFKMIGFVEEVGIDGLVDVAALLRGRTQGSPVVLDDIGSGALIDTSRYGLSKEPMPRDSIAAGVDIACFSGDKLLGGPQAGLLVGTRAAIERCRKHPFARAFRADKLTLAALGATLLHYARGEAEREIPVIRMMALTPDEIEQRARALIDATGLDAEIIEGQSTVGGGSLPGETLPTRLIALNSPSPDAELVKLRAGGVIARITGGRVVLDLRTVIDDADLLWLTSL